MSNPTQSTTPGPFNPVSQPNWPVLSRLGLYDPTSQTYGPVAAGSIGGGEKQNIYIVTHGWADGYAQIVQNYANANNGAPLMVWQTVSYPPGGTPAGGWIFEPTFGPQGEGPQGADPILVSPVGMAQAITEVDPHAIVLVYSWLDGSATPSGLANGTYSQMNTDLFGLVASQAILQALVADFSTTGNQLHLMGHSDGAKVMTVAAAQLIASRIPVAQLTLLDSPEDLDARLKNSANFVWYYLQNVPGTRPPSGPTGTFIDSYISMFGTPLAVFSYTDPNGTAVALSQIVDTHLASDVLYGNSFGSYKYRHAYAPAWYSGTSLDQIGGGNQYGLGWSPLLQSGTVAGGLPQEEKQTWTQPPLPANQFALAQTSAPSQTPSFTSLNAGTLSLFTSFTVSQSVEINLPGIAVDGFSFDYLVLGSYPLTFFTVALNGIPLFAMYANYSGPSWRTATLNAAALQAGVGTLTFTLNTYPSPSDATLQISNLCYFNGLTV